MKKKRIKIICIIAITFIVFLIARAYGTQARGNSALGGEALILLLPITCMLVKRTIRDFAEYINQLKGEVE